MLNARRTAIVKAFGADSIPCWRGQLELLGLDGEPKFADPDTLSDLEAADLARAEKDMGLPVEQWLRTLGYDPDASLDGGPTLAEAVRAEAEQSAAAIGRSFREGAGL